MRPAYLNALRLSEDGWFRDVEVDGVLIGQVKKARLGVSTPWVHEVPGRAYASPLEAAEALAVTHFDGPVACATFDAERIKEQAS